MFYICLVTVITKISKSETKENAKKKKICFQTIDSVMAITKQDCQYSIYQKLKKHFGKSNGFHLWK